MSVQLKVNENISVEQLRALYQQCDKQHLRPADSDDAMSDLLRHSNLTVTAWDKERLIGIARAITDFYYEALLSDLMVLDEYDQRGVRLDLLTCLRAQLKITTRLLHFGEAEFAEFFSGAGFRRHPSGWIIPGSSPFFSQSSLQTAKYSTPVAKKGRTVAHKGLTYTTERPISHQQMAELLANSSLGERRPLEDKDIMENMVSHTSIMVTVWDGEMLVAFSRTLTDFAFDALGADMVVRDTYQSRGVGLQVVKFGQPLTRESTRLLLISAPEATAYYKKIGLQQHLDTWVLFGKDPLPSSASSRL